MDMVERGLCLLEIEKYRWATIITNSDFQRQQIYTPTVSSIPTKDAVFPLGEMSHDNILILFTSRIRRDTSNYRI